MKTLKYETEIAASPAVVWKTMLAPDTYREWTKAFSPNSRYEGEWIEGTTIKFIDPGKGGTKALLERVVTEKQIHANHIATIDKDGVEDSESEMARKWVGTTENYELSECAGGTKLTVVTVVDTSFAAMFADCWPQALQCLKELCEK
jgi:uncharacterized protein YndB with AHSA1/START domain